MNSSMHIHVYLFEVRAIQSFLFATGKLKDMVAGSELLDYLCTQPLQNALEVSGLKGLSDASMNRSPRCAGGSFYLIIDNLEQAQRFQRIWTVLVSQLLPGVEQVDALVSATTAKKAIRKGLDELRTARNMQRVHLPPASPCTERSPRTGNAAVARSNHESLDEATRVKRGFRRPADSKTLAQRFSTRDDIYWPDNFESTAHIHSRFPLREGDRVALIHADGNGLGEILRVINQEVSHATTNDDYVKLYRDFSDGLEAATVKACQAATEEILMPKISSHNVVPARPLVLGGDDLTLLIRADLAVMFTEKFILAFEQASASFLEQLKAQLNSMNLVGSQDLPDKLTVCSGIAFMKPNQPFSQCYALAESLCDRAKKASRQARQSHANSIASSLAFHRILVSLIEDANTLFEREMFAQPANVQLGLEAYAIGSTDNSLAKLDDLKALAGCFGSGQLNDKRLRALATLLHIDPAAAQKDYARWREQAQKSPQQKNALKKFDRLLGQLLGNCREELPVATETGKTVLTDLLTYLTLGAPWNIDSATESLQ